ncbi:MAG: GNAT family N-acetyltransferase [Steroidobacteraceae bacterium]
MSAYPAHLIAEHRLSDGRSITIRPIRRDDGDRVLDFLNATSEDSRYSRFHQWVRAPSAALIHFLTDVDYDRHMALVSATGHGDGEVLVGEARYIASADGKSCDFGILIEDAWHKSGIAGLLMETLIRAARERGLTTMEGLVLANNQAMLNFAHQLGFDVRPAPGDPTTVRIALNLQAGA